MRRAETIRTILTALFVTCMVVANVLAVKQVQLPWGLTMTAGMVVFPLTYALSDVFSERYGYGWSRLTCYLALGANLLAVLAFAAAIGMQPASYWGGQEAFAATLGSTPRILLASAVSYVLGDLANDVAFREMRRRQGERGFWARALASSIVGEIVDSAIFYVVAFAGVLQLGDIATLAAVGVVGKLLIEAAVMPATAAIAKMVPRIEEWQWL